MTHSVASPATDTFPDLLRQHRVRAGLTQRALADLSTVSPRAIRDLEAGRANARTQTIHLLANGLHLQGTARDQFIRASLSGRDGPCRSSETHTPRPVGALRGRDDEVRAITTELRSGVRRMICLSGLPGAGKTRIAAEVAGRLSDAGLAVVWTGARLPAAGIAGLHDHTHEVPDVRRLDPRQPALLVLDGVATDPFSGRVADLMSRYPHLRVLSTSRAAWHVPGVQATVVSPLPVPGPESPIDELADAPAVRLFADRLAEVQPGFVLGPGNAAAVAEMCRRLDGLPLALETVAIRGRVLSLAHLLRTPVEDLLELCVPGGPSASLGSLLGDAVRHLDHHSRTLLRTLARRSGAWTIPAAATALGRSLDEVVDTLDVVLGHGLLQVSHGEVTELRMPNLLRAFLAQA